MIARGSPLQRILAVARKEWVDTLRDRRTIIVTLATAALAGPLFLMLIFNMIAQQGERARELKLAVRGAEHAGALVAFLERQQVTITPAPDDFEAQIRAGDLDVVMIVEPKFAEDTKKGRAATVRLVYDRSRDRARASIDQAETLLRAYNRQWGQMRLLLRGIAPEVGNPLNIETVNLATPQQSGALVLFLVAFYGLLAAIVGGMAVALDATAGERERASLEPLLMTPATPIELVTGKWLATTLFNACVVLITLAGFWATLAFAPLPPVGVPFLFGATELLRFVVILLPLIALVPALLLWIGTRGRTYKEAQANVSVLMLVVSIIPFASQLLQRREPDWITLVPISGQYALLNRALRGEAIPTSELALSSLLPVLLIGFALLAVARLWSRESILIGK
ncbi:MAG TPA: ABC transporter permease [Casimicrobiaceae bacterium]|nr:ABC transporter permease [Casimicrobiaceae bacterium]